jgi:hypothetical protein
MPATLSLLAKNDIKVVQERLGELGNIGRHQPRSSSGVAPFHHPPAAESPSDGESRPLSLSFSHPR